MRTVRFELTTFGPRARTTSRMRSTGANAPWTMFVNAAGNGSRCFSTKRPASNYEAGFVSSICGINGRGEIAAQANVVSKSWARLWRTQAHWFPAIRTILSRTARHNRLSFLRTFRSRRAGKSTLVTFTCRFERSEEDWSESTKLRLAQLNRQFSRGDLVCSGIRCELAANPGGVRSSREVLRLPLHKS